MNIFNRTKIDELSSYRFYNYRLKFIDNANKIKLLKTRIYFISNHKLKQVKKYLNKYLKKSFITLSKASFIFSILFIKKLNDKLRFYIDYRRLNEIIKRNRYSISLIDKMLIRVQEYRYLTRLNIIVTFNKLRIYSKSENYTIFITFLRVYKYRVLSFDLTNGPTTY